VPKQLLLQIEIHLESRIQTNQTRVHFDRSVQASGIGIPSTPEILRVPGDQYKGPLG